MKFGIGIPNAREGVFYPPGFCNASQLVELTLLAESLGFDSIWATDFMSPVPEIGIPAGRNPAWYELMVTLSYLAGVTERIKLGAGVAVLPFRDPIVLAKQAATLDHFSGGRFILGAGAGVFKTELRAIQGRLQKPHRGRMLDEHLQALNLLLNTEGRVSFSGEYYQFTNVELDPKPVQKPLPIQIAGFADSTFERVARHATGLSTVFKAVSGEYRDVVDRLRPALEAEGRNLSEVDLQFTTFQLLDQHHDRAVERAMQSYLVKERGAYDEETLGKALVGTPAEAIEQIAGLEAQGATHYVVTTYPVDTFEEMTEQVKMFANEVMPAFTEPSTHKTI
jgi:probable F420-dependent oxidoreductase